MRSQIIEDIVKVSYLSEKLISKQSGWGLNPGLVDNHSGWCTLRQWATETDQGKVQGDTMLVAVI